MADWTTINYGEFTKDLSTYIESQKATIKIELPKYKYKGFTPLDVFTEFLKICKEKSFTKEKAMSDVVMMLSIYMTRGPNVSKISAANIEGGQEYASKVSKLVEDYNIKSNKPDSLSITLPRMSMIFAVQAYKIYLDNKEILTSWPVSGSEISLDTTSSLSYNFVPCLLDSNTLRSPIEGLVFSIHNIYQSVLTRKTTAKDAQIASKYFPNAVKYARLACEGTLIPSDIMITWNKTLLDEITDQVKAKYPLAMKTFFKTLPNELSDEVTCLTYIVNHCISNSKPISTIDDAHFLKSLDQVKVDLR
jgi:hypothetical protein